MRKGCIVTLKDDLELQFRQPINFSDDELAYCKIKIPKEKIGIVSEVETTFAMFEDNIDKSNDILEVDYPIGQCILTVRSRAKCFRIADDKETI